MADTMAAIPPTAPTTAIMTTDAVCLKQDSRKKRCMEPSFCSHDNKSFTAVLTFKMVRFYVAKMQLIPLTSAEVAHRYLHRRD